MQLIQLASQIGSQLLATYDLASYILLVSVYDHDGEVAIYLLTYHQQTNQSQQTNRQTKVFQEVVSPEVSKLNHAEMSKKQGHLRSYAVFSRKKNRKKKMSSSNPSYQSMDCVIKWVFDSSILLEIFSFVSKSLAISKKFSCK